MRILVLIFLSASVFAQPSGFESLQSGTPTGWIPKTILQHYDVPEPVGPVELLFSNRDKPRSSVPFDGTDLGRLLAGSISYTGLGFTVDLPNRLSECLPRARPREATFSTLYIEPENDELDWFDEFRGFVSLPYGRFGGLDESGERFITAPEVEFTIAGNQIHRIVFINGSGQRRPMEPVNNTCPGELISWAMEQP